MKVFEILNESSDTLEDLRNQLSHERDMFSKIDHPSKSEHDDFNRIVADLNKKIQQFKKQPTATEQPSKIPALKQQNLDKAEANLKKAQEKLRSAKTDREKKSWKANVEVAKYDLRKAQQQMK
ncbi:MAG: hypothetical protein EO766_11715 [Hydrotalea sp. AMD]|uniref:hypothetical protein n=1 Tax=Hydrotalea sp. AMD TaxID=2501297 RepID=UPI0010284909|nr:hypothetical protein [Hydrotalea sp. AMD]RWZ87192.1 MAG: hypothetical protein EO766_11715 [Hydrotalea sp. AMD]